MARKSLVTSSKPKWLLDALKGEKTIAQLSSEYGVHANQINTWKQQAREKLPELFGRPSGLDEQRREVERDRLYQQIGRLQVDVDWLRKKPKALTTVSIPLIYLFPFPSSSAQATTSSLGRAGLVAPSPAGSAAGFCPLWLALWFAVPAPAPSAVVHAAPQLAPFGMQPDCPPPLLFAA